MAIPNYTLTFIHQSPDGTTHKVAAEDESEDLLFFLCKLDALAGVVHPHRTIVIDKLDDGLAPEQAQWLVDVFRPLMHKTS